MPDPRTIQGLFRAVAPRYDRLNHLLSLSLDRWWRRQAARRLVREGTERVVDVCAGTGDLARACARRLTRGGVVAVDFCPEMLERIAGKTATARVRSVTGDALRLPFADGRFDAAAVAFGIRNVADAEGALREFTRVVRPGGLVLVLEFSRPRLPLFGPAYSWYFRRVLPRVGDALSGNGVGAYRWLRDSVLAFPEGEAFLEVLRRAGLERASARRLTGGVVTIYEARKPGGA